MNSDPRFIPIGQWKAEDVFIVGYPKSGNTWFQNLAAGVVYGVLPEFAPPALVSMDLIPDIYQNQFYRRYATPMFFKSHNLPQPEYRRVVYLLRDGRDVMVSYFHHLCAREKRPDFLQMVETGKDLFPCKWQEHVDAWLKNPHQAEMLTVRYEDLLADPAAQLERFCHFIGVKRSSAFLEMIAKSSSFANLRSREERMGRAIEKQTWRPEILFFRRGIAGSHRDEMPEHIREAFVKQAGPALRAAGYAS